MSRPVARARFVAALGIAVVSVTAAAFLGAFSKTAGMGERAATAARDASRAPVIGTAESRLKIVGTLPDGSEVVLDGPLVPPVAGQPSAGVTARTSKGAAAVAVAPGATTRPAADEAAGDGRGTLRVLASFNTYSIGEVVCHWHPADAAYNPGNYDKAQNWDAIPITSLPIGQAHTTHTYDFIAPGDSSSAYCAANTPYPPG